MRKFNHLTEILTLTAVALLGIPDAAHGQSLTFASANPVVLGIAGPGGTTTSSIAVSSTAGINGALTVTNISTTDRTNWLCGSASGQSLVVSIGTGCNSTSSSQLLNNTVYTGSITVTAPTSSSGTQSGTLNVTLQVGNSNPSLVANPNPVNFSVQTGGTAPSQTVNITFNGATVQVQSVSASTNTGQNWLLPSIGSSSVLVSLNAAGMSAGSYNGTVTVGTSAGTLSFPVNLSVGGIPTLSVNPMALNFAYQISTGVPLPQTIALTSSGTAVNVTVSASTNSGGTQWLIVSPTGQLTTPTQITVSIQPSGLAAGATYTGNVQINSSGGTVNVPVSLLVSNNPIIAANPASLTFTAQAGSTAASQSLALNSSGAALAYTLSLERHFARGRELAAGSDSVWHNRRYSYRVGQYERTGCRNLQWRHQRVGADCGEQQSLDTGNIEHRGRSGAAVQCAFLVVRLSDEPIPAVESDGYDREHQRNGGLHSCDTDR